MAATETRLGSSRLTTLRGRWRVPWELCIALAIQFLMIVPILRTAYEFDDQINSTTKGALHISHMGWWDFSTTIVRGWLDGPGRWFPVGFYWGYAQAAVFYDLLLYKWLLVVYSLLACIVVYALMRELGAGRGPSALVVVGMAVASQLRLYPDPHLAYGGLTQVVTMLLAGAMIAYQRWLKGGPWPFLVACLFLTAVAASTYEAVYLCAPLFVIQAIRERDGLKAVATASLGPGCSCSGLSRSAHTCGRMALTERTGPTRRRSGSRSSPSRSSTSSSERSRSPTPTSIRSTSST